MNVSNKINVNIIYLLKTINHVTVLFNYVIFISVMKDITVIAPFYILVLLYLHVSDLFCLHFCKCFFGVFLEVDSLRPYDRVYGMQLQPSHRSDKAQDLLFWTGFSVGNANGKKEKEVMYMYTLGLYLWLIVFLSCVKITMII